MHDSAAPFDQLRSILAEVTGNEVGDIHPDSLLVDDLGMTDVADMPRLIKRINRDFEITLNPTHIADEVESVEDLLTLIIDETELG